MNAAHSHSDSPTRTLSSCVPIVSRPRPMASAPVIQRVQPLRPRGLKVLVHLDDGEPFEVMLEALERSRIGVGDELTPQRKHNLLNHDQDVRVRDAALNLISYRARTRTELRRRLVQKDFRPARVDVCLDQLAEKGLIDDRAVAAAFTRDRLRHRPRGTRAIAAELRRKGVDPELAKRTISEVFETEEVDDDALARTVGRQWVARQNAATRAALASPDASPERIKAQRRLMAYLSRRGFGGPAMTAGIESAKEAAAE